MTWIDHIHADPAVLGRKPVIKGTRLAVDFVLALLAEGWSREERQKNYPQLTNGCLFQRKQGVSVQVFEAFRRLRS